MRVFARHSKSTARAAATISLVATLAGGALAQEAPTARDLGAMRAATPVSALVWLKGSRDASLEAAVSSLYEPTSPTYHRWLTDAELERFAPSPDEQAAAHASLEAQGLHVQQVLEGGSLVRVSGTAASLQSAFATTIHQWQAGKRTYLRAVKAPVYQGADAQLVGGVAALGSDGARPFIARQRDPATGKVAAALVPPAGTDPLASFTTQCFTPGVTADLHGLALLPPKPDGSSNFGSLHGVYTGMAFLDPVNTHTRKPCGYTADQLVRHYGVAEAHAMGWTGRGQTIVIVDAYGSPTLAADVATFSSAMGLPAMDAKDLQVVYPDGLPGIDDGGGWADETTLDVEWAHAFAPDAKIVVVVAPSNDNAELAYAVEYAARHRLGNVISNSWGLPEAQGDLGTVQMFDQAFRQAAARGIAVNVSSGDAGDNGVGNPLGGASIPADSRYATSVGGTAIDVPSDRGPVETSWGDTESYLGSTTFPMYMPFSTGFLRGSGGGESVFLRKPAWQRHLPGTGRQQPDIAAVADPRTGGIMVQTLRPGDAPRWSVVGGTSLASPIFSAIWALANQAAGESLGQAGPTLAAMPEWAIRDVLPIDASRINAKGTMWLNGVKMFDLDAAQLIYVDQVQPTGSLTTLVALPSFPVKYLAIGFGADSSLIARRGWDNATGYGVPNGVPFLMSAALFGRNHH